MRGIMLAVLFFATVGATAAPAPFPNQRQSKADLKKLQGTWLLVRIHNPRAWPKYDAATADIPAYLQVTGSRAAWISKDTRPWRITLDATKMPKTMDWTFPPPSNPHGRRVFLGIYNLKGDTLTFALHGEKTRPSGFSGNDVIVYTFKRR
jgi:uncharacterized protein (TIGR03067 family)